MSFTRIPVLAALALAACGGGSDEPAARYAGTLTVVAGTASATCAATHDVAITPTGFTPATLQVPIGDCVRFVNQDGAPHWPESNPHPDHTQCPWLNRGSALPAGASAVFGPAPGPEMACGFHDHLNPPSTGGGTPY